MTHELYNWTDNKLAGKQIWKVQNFVRRDVKRKDTEASWISLMFNLKAELQTTFPN